MIILLFAIIVVVVGAIGVLRNICQQRVCKAHGHLPQKLPKKVNAIVKHMGLTLDCENEETRQRFLFYRREGVACSVVLQRYYCSRCSAMLPQATIVEVEGTIHRLSAPAKYFKKLKEKGYVVDE